MCPILPISMKKGVQDERHRCVCTGWHRGCFESSGDWQAAGSRRRGVLRGGLGWRGESDADGIRGVLRAVPEDGRFAGPALRSPAAGVRQQQRPEGPRRARDAGSVRPRRADPLRAHQLAAGRPGRGRSAGDVQGGVRGQRAAGAEARDARGLGRVAGGAGAGRLGTAARRAVRPGHRQHGQAALRRAGGRGAGLQPQEAGPRATTTTRSSSARFASCWAEVHPGRSTGRRGMPGLWALIAAARCKRRYAGTWATAARRSWRRPRRAGSPTCSS